MKILCDKPKSQIVWWRSFMVAGAAWVVAFLGMVLASITYIPGLVLVVLGCVVFIGCVLTGFAMWFVMVWGMLTGKHRNVQPRRWQDQVW